MLPKSFIQLLCLSLVMVSIEAMTGPQQNENELPDDREPELEAEEPEQSNDHDQNQKYNDEQQDNDNEMENLRPGMAEMPLPHRTMPPQEMMAQLLPLLQRIANRKSHKTGRMDATDDTKLQEESKAKAYIMTKIKTVYSETVVENEKNNQSKVLTKTLEQNGESSAVIDFKSGLDIISDKMLEAKTDKQTQPIEKIVSPDIEKFKSGPSQMKVKRHIRQLRRMKRETGQGGDNTWGEIMGAFKKVGDAVGKAWKKHVEEPAKKMAQNVMGDMAQHDGQTGPGHHEEAPEQGHEE